MGSRHTVSTTLTLLALSGCGDADTTELEDTIAAQQAQVDALLDEITDMRSEMEGIERELDSTKTALAACATTEVLAGYATTESLMDYATMTWVDSQYSALAAVDADLAATLQGQEDRIGTIEEEYAAADAILADADADLSTRIDDINTRTEAIEEDYVRQVDTDTTVTVTTGQELINALAELDGLIIGQSAVYTISITAAALSFTEPLYLSHPSGGQLRIEGTGSTASLLYFPNGDGIVVEDGTDIGYLGGVGIIGNGTGTGLTVTDASSLTVGDIRVDSFGDSGVAVLDNAALTALDTVTVERCGQGFYVSGSGYALVEGSIAEDNVGDGFFVEKGGFLTADSSWSASNDNGYTARTNGGMSARDASAGLNRSDGFLSEAGGFMDSTAASTTSNGDNGFDATHGSFMDASDTHSDTNGEYGYRAAYYSGMLVYRTTSTGNTNGDYAATYQGYIHADGVLGETTKVSYGHDITDFIYGL